MQAFRMVLTALLFLLSGPHLLADGKMYAEKVNTKIPYQRALILHDEGMQTMVLQSQYEIPNEPGEHTLGWVVPVPAVPEIFSMDADTVDQLFKLLSGSTSPDTVEISVYFSLISLAVIVLCVVLVFASFFPRYSDQRKRMLWISFICSTLSIIQILHLLVSARAWKGVHDIEVVRSGKVGIYDTKVIKANSAKNLIDWFNAHSFRFDVGDETVIQSYIDRNWCFVTATVDASVTVDDSSAVYENLLAPLILRFPAPIPVYPTALTATGGHPTEILIYLAASRFMKTNPDLTPRYAGEPLKRLNESLQWILLGDAHGYEQLSRLDHFPPIYKWFELPMTDKVCLHKFKATLTPEQMVEDIEFHPDPEGKPYREIIYKW